MAGLHDSLEYNTTRDHLIIREYGRNIQKLIRYTKTIEDSEKRNRTAKSIVALMEFINPSLRNVEEYHHKVWDHLFIISEFELDADSPYEKPRKEDAKPVPRPIPYPDKKIRFWHYGKYVERLMANACEEQDEAKQRDFVRAIGNYMKLVMRNRNKDAVTDDMVREDIKTLSKGKITLPEGFTFETLVKQTFYPKRKPAFTKGPRKRPRRHNY